MARVAKIKGDPISVVTITPGVAEYHLTTGESEGDIRVTPVVFGRVQNTDAFVVPQSVLTALRKVK